MAKFPDKLRNLLSDEFVDAVMEESTENLQKRVYDYQKIIEDTEKEKGEDETLAEAKAEVRRLTLKYSDVVKSQQAMIKYIFYTLRDRGAID